MRQSCFIANQGGRDILVAEWPYTDLAEAMLYDPSSLSSECFHYS